MLALILVYSIGRAFYNLAHDYHKNRWVFGILGAVVYYVGTIIGTILLGIILEFTDSGSIEEFSGLVLGLMVMPFGILICFIFYVMLKDCGARNLSLKIMTYWIRRFKQSLNECGATNCIFFQSFYQG